VSAPRPISFTGASSLKRRVRAIEAHINASHARPPPEGRPLFEGMHGWVLMAHERWKAGVDYGAPLSHAEECCERLERMVGLRS
jgi:hypothetical protein